MKTFCLRSVAALSILQTIQTAPLVSTLAGQVRPPAVAGAFYPADSAQLDGMLTEMLVNSKVLSPRVMPSGLVSPHAGYIYSGIVAAAGYRQLQGFHYKTVVIVAPSHREYFEHAALLCSGSYAMPLGEVRINEALARKIAASGGEDVQCSQRGHIQTGMSMGEHSLEVQLPLLQKVLGAFTLVPIVMGKQDGALSRVLGEALAGAIGPADSVLLVASSDLSHYHSYAEANRLDGRLAGYVGGYDCAGLRRALGSGEVEACGGGPILAVMEACRRLGATEVKITEQANSGDTSGEKNRVVGYLSAVLYKPADVEKASQHNLNPGEAMPLTEEEKQYLLSLARRTIENVVRGEKLPAPEAITPVLAENRGAFVTIKKRGQLRGCIGLIQGIKPLVETVSEMASAAALRDPRFNPVTRDELPELELEISALTPIKPVKDVRKVQVGRDGLIVRRGQFQGLLLPQVATEYGWDRDTFLAQTCRKAGLPPDAWKAEGTEISSFSAEVFCEKEH